MEGLFDATLQPEQTYLHDLVHRKFYLLAILVQLPENMRLYKDSTLLAGHKTAAECGIETDDMLGLSLRQPGKLIFCDRVRMVDARLAPSVR